MKHPAVVLLIVASTLTLVRVMLNLVREHDQADAYAGLSRRQRFIAENRRHPRARAIQLVCLAAALGLYISFAVVSFA